MSSHFVEELKRRAAEVRRTIAYPEPGDSRIRQAVERIVEEGIAEPLLVGPSADLPTRAIPGVRALPIEDPERLERFAQDYARRRGVREALAARLVRKPLIHGAMMVALGCADGMVAGIAHQTGSVAQAAQLCVGLREGIRRPSSCFIMVLPRLGERRDVPLVFADCAVNIEPDAEALADTALASAETARVFLRQVPRVAMLSFSTAGSVGHPKVDLVRRAVELARGRLKEGFVEGELQFDAALVPEVARIKVKGESEVAGMANVLVFPDLNAGNIAYKAVQYTGGAHAIGPIFQGFARPVNDLSRGASVEDVVALTAVTALQV
jgi:phosphate acetyltransferase